MRHYQQRIIRPIMQQLVVAFFTALLFIMWGQPGHSQGQGSIRVAQQSPIIAEPESVEIQAYEVATVIFDGEPVIQVTDRPAESESESNGEVVPTPVQQRAQIIELKLRSVLKAMVQGDLDPEQLVIKTGRFNQQIVIFAREEESLLGEFGITQGYEQQDEIILTVTTLDAQFAGQSIESLAIDWSEVIYDSLWQAWHNRRPEARQQQRLQAIAITVGVGLINLGITLLNRYSRLLLQKLQQQVAAQEIDLDRVIPRYFAIDTWFIESFSSRAIVSRLQRLITFNILFSNSLNYLGLLCGFAGFIWILYLFPETRDFGRNLLAIPLKTLVIFSVLCLVCKLTELLHRQNLQTWVEHRKLFSQNAERPELRAPTLLKALQGLTNAIATLLGIIWLLIWLKLPINSALAGAGLIGISLSFVFQNILKDWLNGLMIIWEDQYAIGDFIDLGFTAGLVESMSLRATQLRGKNGQLSTIPHNQVLSVHNLTKDWSRIDFRIVIAPSADVTIAMQLMQETIEKMALDPGWDAQILDPHLLIGVDRVDSTGIELLMWIQTRRSQQWAVGREFRRRLWEVFQHQGIAIGVPNQAIAVQVVDSRQPEKP